jgi:septal ring factor EnvC (AmiA/AmiB activator)
VEGANSSMIYLVHCKNLCKCYNVPPPSIIKKRNHTETLEIKSSISQIKNSLEILSTKLDQTEDSILGPEEKLSALEHSGEEKGKKIKNNEWKIKEL